VKTVEYRKLQATLDGTYFVTLPKNWVMGRGLKRGDMLRFEQTFNGRIMVSPHGVEEKTLKEAILEVSPYLERLIGEKYLSGYDIIEVRAGAIFSSEVRERIKKAVKRFVGLEIVEENSRRLVIQCLLEPSLIIPEKVARRVNAISAEMGKDCISSFIQGDEALAKTVMERDEEVDRQYFLLVRLVRTALTHPYISEKLSISPIECLDYRMLASLMEHYADYSVDIAGVSLRCQPNSWLGVVKEALLEVSLRMYEMYKDSFASVLKGDLELAVEVSRKSCEIKDKLTSIQAGILKNKRVTQEFLTDVVMALNSMCEVCVDISDLARAR
jgi:phosphate uptake regulator